jgi:hypothetical protein
MRLFKTNEPTLSAEDQAALERLMAIASRLRPMLERGSDDAGAANDPDGQPDTLQ